MEYKFKFKDEYKVFFDVACSYASEDECILEVDGSIYIEDFNGNEVDVRSLSKKDRETITQLVEDWLDTEQLENGDSYYRDYSEGMADYYNDILNDR